MCRGPSRGCAGRRRRRRGCAPSPSADAPRCPRPLQFLHLSLITLPRPPPLGQTSENENGPWSTATDPAVAGRAALGERAGLGAGAVAHVARRFRRDVHRGGDAVHRVEEVEVELGLDVVAAGGRRDPRCGLAGRRPPPPNRLPKRPPRSPRSPRSSTRTLPNPPGPPTPKPPEASGPTRADPGHDHLAHLVVLLALLGVAEHVVRRGDLLEAVLGRLVPALASG